MRDELFEDSVKWRNTVSGIRMSHKSLREKEKMLKTSIFSFSDNVFVKDPHIQSNHLENLLKLNRSKIMKHLFSEPGPIVQSVALRT